jgi:hypothetical protein
MGPPDRPHIRQFFSRGGGRALAVPQPSPMGTTPRPQGHWQGPKKRPSGGWAAKVRPRQRRWVGTPRTAAPLRQLGNASIPSRPPKTRKERQTENRSSREPLWWGSTKGSPFDQVNFERTLGFRDMKSLAGGSLLAAFPEKPPACRGRGGAGRRSSAAKKKKKKPGGCRSGCRNPKSDRTKKVASGLPVFGPPEHAERIPIPLGNRAPSPPPRLTEKKFFARPQAGPPVRGPGIATEIGYFSSSAPGNPPAAFLKKKL